MQPISIHLSQGAFNPLPRLSILHPVHSVLFVSSPNCLPAHRNICQFSLNFLPGIRALHPNVVFTAHPKDSIKTNINLFQLHWCWRFFPWLKTWDWKQIELIYNKQLISYTSYLIFDIWQWISENLYWIIDIWYLILNIWYMMMLNIWYLIWDTCLTDSQYLIHVILIIILDICYMISNNILYMIFDIWYRVSKRQEMFWN